ncbi:MAG: thiamine pyrophosphate-dependent enzyme [FCB group bacterium]|jgi:2-oxoglutarate ferredoxin oxidoreductase subunit beta
MRNQLLKYLRTETLPTEFCPGCGGGTVLNIFCHVIDEMKINPDDIITVTGIGCSSWIPSPYFSADTLHTTHGRAIAFATGVKVMKPEKHVIVIAGDGDIAGIGGNHLIHAARRNIDLTVLLVNNYIYGMTGGQVSPTTPFSTVTTTTPFGNAEQPFRIAELVAAAGAAYVARWTTYHIFQLKKAIKDAINKKGFSFVEICSQCPTSYGKRVGKREGIDQLKDFRDKSISINSATDEQKIDTGELYIIGKLVERSRQEFVDSLKNINEKFEVA